MHQRVWGALRWECFKFTDVCSYSCYWIKHGRIKDFSSRWPIHAYESVKLPFFGWGGVDIKGLCALCVSALGPGAVVDVPNTPQESHVPNTPQESHMCVAPYLCSFPLCSQASFNSLNTPSSLLPQALCMCDFSLSKYSYFFIRIYYLHKIMAFITILSYISSQLTFFLSSSPSHLCPFYSLRSPFYFPIFFLDYTHKRKHQCLSFWVAYFT
jgi:hypothetical protein